MKVDLLAAEIGSTITVVSAFNGLTTGDPRFLGQGSAPSSVEQGDVRIGIEQAVSKLKTVLKDEALEWDQFAASSSAAGGLRMSVHGLIYDMTVRAAREAALGAGANLCCVTAGAMETGDLSRMTGSRPNILLIAGGVDYGERKTAADNARKIRDALVQAETPIPVIYAGNIAGRGEIREIFSGTAIPLRITDNVYPKIDELVIEPTRRIIQEVFEAHITAAPGMEHIRELVNGTVMPVPGAVMRAARLAFESFGDLVVFDVGGATTDLHSVCEDSPEVGRILLAPEPRAKRTVEGDLGVYINRLNVLEASGGSFAASDLTANPDRLRAAVAALPPRPETAEQQRLTAELTCHAARIALERHAGRYRSLYTMNGKQRFAEGKDLTAVRTVVGTGGALTRLPHGKTILKKVLDSGNGLRLYPPRESRILLDSDYIMACVGVFADQYPEAAAKLIERSLLGT